MDRRDQCDRLDPLCNAMCPIREIRFRERENLLHPLEMVKGTERLKQPKADLGRTVKCYVRSAAGLELCRRDIVRPVEMLIKTLNYLFENVLLDESHKFHVVYDFVNDRVKAVRQDMVLQDVSASAASILLQPIVRFYAYSAYRLCECPPNIFDSKLNNDNLLECLKKLMFMYDQFDICENIGVYLNCPVNFMAYMQSRPEFEAMYLLFNIGQGFAIERALSLPTKWKVTVLNTCLIISQYYRQNNWYKCCRLINKLPPLLKGLAALKLSDIRRQALCAMSVAFSSKVLSVPLSWIQGQLLYFERDDLIMDCKHYKIACDSEYAFFKRDAMTQCIRLVRDRHEKFADDVFFNFTASDLVLSDIIT